MLKNKKIISFVFITFLLSASALAETAPLSFEDKSPLMSSVDLGEGRISLDLKSISVPDLFRLLSMKTGKTIVPSRSLKGRIDLFLNDTSYDEALDIILVSQGYAVEKKDDIYYVMTNEEYLANFGIPFLERREVKNISFRYADPDNLQVVLSELKSEIGKVIVDKSTSTLILLDTPEKNTLMEKTIALLDRPLKTKVYSLNYASAEKIKSHVEEMTTAGIGKVIVDERSRNIVVTDVPGNIAKIDGLIQALDAETEQVYIKAEIIQLTFTDNSQQGVDWTRLFKQKRFDGLTFNSDFNVLTGSEANFGKMSVGVAGSNSYTLMLEFLEEQGEVKILSRPQIAVVNNQDAQIHVGVEQPFISSTLSKNDTSSSESYTDEVEYKDVGVMLRVKPVIGRDGFITVDIKPEISSIKETITTNAGSVIPVLEKSTAESKIKVKDGSMVMIAGLIQDKRSDVEKGIPILKDLPMLGNLFRNSVVENEKTELIVFLTPTLMRGDVSVLNTDFANNVPADIMPEEYKNRVILQELMNISKADKLIDAADSKKRNIKGLKEL